MSFTTATTTVPIPWMQCRHCGLIHYDNAVCPRIKTISYYANGTIKRVEYHESFKGMWGSGKKQADR